MINQLLMIKFVRLRIKKCDLVPGDLKSVYDYQVTEARCKWGQSLTNMICWSASSSYELRSALFEICLLYTSPSPRDVEESRMPSSA